MLRVLAERSHVAAVTGSYSPLGAANKASRPNGQGQSNTPDARCKRAGLFDWRLAVANTRPHTVPGSKPDPSEWLTVREAVRFHYENTPRQKPIHRSAMYRIVHDPEHPVRGEWFAGELFVDRASLEAFVRGGRRRRPGSGRGRRHATPADATHAAAAIERLRNKHGIATDAKGGEAE